MFRKASLAALFAVMAIAANQGVWAQTPNCPCEDNADCQQSCCIEPADPSYGVCGDSGNNCPVTADNPQGRPVGIHNIVDFREDRCTCDFVDADCAAGNDICWGFVNAPSGSCVQTGRNVPPPEPGAFCYSAGNNQVGNFFYCAARPPCDIFKIKAKKTKLAGHGNDTKLDIIVSNTLKGKEGVSANMTIALPSGVTFVESKSPSKKVGEPRLVGENVVVDLDTLRPRRSAKVSLTVRLPGSSSTARTLVFPVRVEAPSRNCIDNEIIQLSTKDMK